jgi:hypothetical protein
MQAPANDAKATLFGIYKKKSLNKFTGTVHPNRSPRVNKTSSSGQQFPFFAAHHPNIRKDRKRNRTPNPARVEHGDAPI